MIKQQFRRGYDFAYGKLHKVCPIPLGIRVGAKSCGFFGNLAITLNGIRFCELNCTNCEVHWGKTSLYYDPAIGGNAWSYYFQQSKFRFAEDLKSEARIVFPYRPTAHSFSTYAGLNERDSLSRAIERYCVLQPEIEQIVNDVRSREFNSAVLGVHYRGTDVAAGFEHRTPVDPLRIIRSIDRWLQDTPSGRIFVATDEQFFVEKLKAAYGDRVFYTNAIRSSNGSSIHGHYDGGVPGSPKQKGVEVLVDATLLSCCQMLLHHESRVAWFAKAKNPRLETIDFAGA